MKKIMSVVGLAVLLGALPVAYGHKSAEMFIPLGQSPGVSGTQTVIGTVQGFNSQTQTVTVTSTSGSAAAVIANSTKIWLDRSKLQQSTQTGSTQHLVSGAAIEVKYAASKEKGGVAEWVKVEAR